MSTARWRLTAHTCPKAGHAAHENEDAWAHAWTPDGTLHLAVADGATETAFARPWAHALAGAAARTGSVAGAWAKAAAHHTQQVEAQRAGLPWFAAAKADEGAAAALLVVRLFPDGRFEAEATGDCCMLVIDNARIVLAWPLDTPDAFSHRPVLINSLRHPPPALSTEARLPPDASLVLATDALAAFLLHEGAGALAPFEADFEPAVAAARGRGLRNDDTTLVCISAQAAG